MNTALNGTVRLKQIAWKNKIAYVFQATHFVPCISSTLYTTIMALLVGQRTRLYLLVPAVVLGQFSVGWYNDYLDRDRDRIAGRTDKPIAMGLIDTKTIKLIGYPSCILSVLLAFGYGGVRAGVVYSVALLSALLYDYKLKRTVLSMASIMLSFGLLPVYVGLSGMISTVPALWMILSTATLGACLHIQHAIPDYEDDAKTGVKGFVHYFSRRQILIMGVAMLCLSVGSVIFGVRNNINVVTWVASGFFVLATIIFAQNFIKNDYKKAFGMSMRMMLLTIVITLSAAPSMFK